MSADPLFSGNPAVYERPRAGNEDEQYKVKLFTEGLNLYEYVEGNPVRYNDPMGHRLDDCEIRPIPEQKSNNNSSLSSIISDAWNSVKNFFSGSSPSKMKAEATRKVNKMFDEALAVNNNLTGSALFKGVVDNLTKQFENVKYQNEDQLAYTYAALMRRMGKEFGAPGDNHINYGFAVPEICLYDEKTGSMRETDHVDCTNFQTIGINILGLNKPGAHNVSENLPNSYDYGLGIKLQTDAGAVKNFRYNTTLFRKVQASSISDLTGTIGVTYYGGKYNHAFTSLNSDSSFISESEPRGIRTTKAIDTIKRYKETMKAEYLRLILPAWKKY